MADRGHEIVTSAWDRTMLGESQGETCAIHGDSLSEIGCIHAAAGRRAAARDSFEKALAQARGDALFRDMLKGQPNHYEDRLEGKFAAALLLLDPIS